MRTVTFILRDENGNTLASATTAREGDLPLYVTRTVVEGPDPSGNIVVVMTADVIAGEPESEAQLAAEAKADRDVDWERGK